MMRYKHIETIVFIAAIMVLLAALVWEINLIVELWRIVGDIL